MPWPDSSDTNPHVPHTGEILVTVTIEADGTVSVSREMAVHSRRNLSLTDDEYSMDGSRYNVEHLYPTGAICGGVAPLSHYPTSMHIQCRVADKNAAFTRLRRAFADVHAQVLLDLKAKEQFIIAAMTTADIQKLP